MKLRSLRIGDYRNLQDIEIKFPEQVRVPVYLIVGVNGTGKSGILRALTHIFSALEYNQAPHLPFHIEYQIGRGSENYEVRIDGDGKGTASGVTFEVATAGGEFSPRERGEWPNFLPARTIAYTSGSPAEWFPLLAEADAERERHEQDQAETLREMQKDETEIEEVAGDLDLPIGGTTTDEKAADPSHATFLTPADLQLALLATLAIEDSATAETRTNIYQRAGLASLSRFALRLQPLAKRSEATRLREEIWRLLGDRPDDAELNKRFEALTAGTAPVLPPRLMDRVRELAAFANPRLRNPDGNYHLLFEMNPDTREHLAKMFAARNLFYNFLVELKDWGALTQVDLVLRKSDLSDEILDRHLSDGEYALLSRIALLLLLGQPESLFLLDEPETHFNDVWKRELVDTLATVLDKRASTVLLTTHSSITMSDVPTSQVVLLNKDESGLAQVVDFRAPMFGADPSDIMINVLGTGRAGGVYSARILREALERSDPKELAELLEIVGPGYWRFRIRDRLESLNAAPDQSA